LRVATAPTVTLDSMVLTQVTNFASSLVYPGCPKEFAKVEMALMPAASRAVLEGPRLESKI